MPAESDSHPQDPPAKRRQSPGLASAALIYALAADDEGIDAASEIAHSRMYQHNLQLMGGKASVLMADFDEWFSGLWHGRPLAYTVAVLSVAIALVCFVVARWVSAPPHDAGRGG
jgi:hypothetical protein